jgi:hypothetical protein
MLENVLVPLVLLLVVGFLAYRHFTKSTWQDLPTLQAYAKAFPRCQTSEGIRCRQCGSGSIKNWGWKWAYDARRLFICNHCGLILYRNDLDS